LVLVTLLVFCATVLYVLSRGKYEIASSIFLYGFFLVMFAAIKFDAYQNVYETYVFAALGLFFLVLVGLLGARQTHALVSTVAVLAGVYALYLSDALPLDNGVVTTLAVQNLATCTIIVLAGGAFTAMTIRMQSRLVDETQDIAHRAREQFVALSAAVAKANDAAIAIGNKLAEASESLSTSARQFRGTVSEETSGLATLDETLTTNAVEEENVIKSQDRVRVSLGEYSKKVLEASAAVAEMIDSIGKIGSSAGERQAGVDRLASLARDGKERIKTLTNTIGTIVKATENMDAVNTLIGDVAGRTNLLGMNASIEAAHAGAAGKGFAVVAGEIRNLSQQAASGSSSISAILTETQKAVGDASKASAETNEFFSRMSEEISRVAATLDELLNRIRELSAGTTEVSQAIEGFSGLATATDKEAEDTGNSLRKAADFSAASRDVARNMKDDANSMLQACDSLLAQASAVSELGRENVRRMEELKATVSSMDRI